MPIGPIQLLVVGFDEANFTGEVQAELDRLRDSDVVRVIDMLVVHKQADGTLEHIRRTDVTGDDAVELGATIGALIGYGMAGEEGAEAGARVGAESAGKDPVDVDGSWYVDDAIPAGSAAALVLLEHRWAIPLRESIIRAGGNRLLADQWIHRSDLVDIGILAAAELDT
jgi:uncharacterized membrane protein